MHGSAQSINMGKSVEQKAVILGNIEKRFETATLIFSTDMKKITVKDISSLRNSLPKGTNAICVKNTLMKKVATRAVAADSVLHIWRQSRTELHVLKREAHAEGPPTRSKFVWSCT